MTQVAVVGTGNVGSALLIHLVEVPTIERVLVINLEDDWSKAAIMDAASARPEAALKLEVSHFPDLGESDVVALTSGAQMKKGEVGADLLQSNTQIMNAILDQATLKPGAVVISLATPVDDITAHIQARYGLPTPQVIGFGGDLDRNRLAYVLSKRGLPGKEIGVVGEHGKKTIPFYQGDVDYAQVARDVRNFLGDITAQGGSPRNLATGPLLARLIDSIANDRRRVHFVCGYHQQFDVYLTWPFVVGRSGAHEPQPVDLAPQAEREFGLLLQSRIQRAPGR